jgi:hypothetical protein
MVEESEQLNRRLSSKLLLALCPPSRMPWIPYTENKRFYEDTEFYNGSWNKGGAQFVRGVALQLRRALAYSIPQFLSER